MLHFLQEYWMVIAVYTAAINFITFCTFGADKRRARKDMRRVPEKRLFSLAALGGSVGAIFAMRIFRHKTLHRSFRYGIPAILMAQIAIVAALLYFF